MNNVKSSRPLTDYEQSVSKVVEGTLARIAKLDAERDHHVRFIAEARATCNHDFIGQNDEHPHGTPRETFICSICLKEEVR